MRTILLTLFTFIFCATANADDSGLSLKDMERGIFSNNLTDAQKDIFWDKIKGRTVAVTGSVIDVQSEGWLVEAKIIIDPRNSSVTYHCYVKEELNDTAKQLRKGQKVTCTGMLFNYFSLFGKSFSLEKSSFE